MINAGSETAPEKPYFRRAFRERQCLILADGFYAWKRENGAKQPCYFHMQEGRPFAFTGLWEGWNQDEEIRSCTILTTQADDLVGGIHERMPVILPCDPYHAWLDPESERDQVAALLAPYPGDDLEAYPVSPYMTSPDNDGSRRRIEPAA